MVCVCFPRKESENFREGTDDKRHEWWWWLRTTRRNNMLAGAAAFTRSLNFVQIFSSSYLMWRTRRRLSEWRRERERSEWGSFVWKPNTIPPAESLWFLARTMVVFAPLQPCYAFVWAFGGLFFYFANVLLLFANILGWRLSFVHSLVLLRKTVILQRNNEKLTVAFTFSLNARWKLSSPASTVAIKTL